MKQQYDEIMEHIQVTEEMRSRILQNIRNAPAVAPKKKPMYFSQILRVGTVAVACAVVIFAGSRSRIWMAGKTSYNDMGAGSVEYSAAYTGSGMIDYESAEALAEAVGFAVPQLQALPFAVQEIRYTDIGGVLVQVEYTGENDAWALMRKGAGSDSVSGDYNEYPVELELALDGNTAAQLKGTEDGCTLAEWTANGYAYSLQLSEAQEPDWWQNVLEEVERQELNQ